MHVTMYWWALLIGSYCISMVTTCMVSTGPAAGAYGHSQVDSDTEIVLTQPH